MSDETPLPECGCVYSDQWGVDRDACLYPASIAVVERQQRELNEAKRLLKAILFESAWPHDGPHLEANDWIARQA